MRVVHHVAERLELDDIPVVATARQPEPIWGMLLSGTQILQARRIVFSEPGEGLARYGKLGDEDADLFYDGDHTTAIDRLFGLGVETLLLTHGREGASLRTRSGLSVSVPIAALTKPIVDTMGAGDATLATVIAFILRQGMPGTTEAWRLCLTEAMQVAAATCAHAGGGLMLPETPLKARG